MLVALLAGSILGAPSPRPPDGGSVAQATAAAVPLDGAEEVLPAPLRMILAEVEALRGKGELDLAREKLATILEESAYERLLAREPAVRAEGLAVLDRMAEGLAALQVRKRLWMDAVEHLSRRVAPDHHELLEARANLAATRLRLGEAHEALESLRSVHAARERLLPPDDRELMTTKADLAAAYKALGELERAAELEEHVHGLCQETLPAGHDDLLVAKSNLAVTRKRLGDLEGALALEEEVLVVRRERLPPGHHDLLLTEMNVAVTRLGLGDLPGAHELLEKVHEIWDRTLPKDHSDLLRIKGNLALTRRELGDLKGALALEEHVHSVWEGALSEDHPDLLAAKENLALTRRALEDFAGARELLEEVHETRGRLLSHDHLDLLRSKGNLAIVRKDLGDLDEARVLEESVLEGFERQLTADHPDVLAAKGNLAATRRVLGDVEGARALEEELHAARERLLPEDHPHLLLTKQNLALTRVELGDLEGALELEQDVHASRERLFPAGHPDLLNAKQRLAATLYELGDVEGALSVVRSLLEGQLARATTLWTESPRIARAAAVRELRRLSAVLDWSSALRDAQRESLSSPLMAVLESLRSVSTSSLQVASQARRVPRIRELREDVLGIRAQLNDLVLSSPLERHAVEAWRSEIVRKSEARDRLERTFRNELAKSGSLPAPTGIGELAEQLESAALVTFFRYRREEQEQEIEPQPSPSDSLVAFVLTGDGVPERVELGSCDELGDLVVSWRKSLGRAPARVRHARPEATVRTDSRGIGIGAASSVESERAIGRELRRKLLDPCLARCGEDLPAALHVILDDFLHLVPLEALPWRDERRLGDVLDVRQEVSIQRLTRQREPLRGEGALLAFGAVDFDAEGAKGPEVELASAEPPVAAQPVDRAIAGARFSELPETGSEVEALAELYTEHVAPRAIVLRGPAASKAALHELAAAARYLHVATHGWFAPESFHSMLDELRERGVDSVPRARSTVHAFAPETLCGLALAGANTGPDEDGGVPGILTAEELAAIDLSNCELAVLSACETNVGIRRAGQGIRSLQSALHAAGARTAVTSLWRVDDAATRRLMELFYRNLWGEGLGKARALRKAKKALRAQGHPVRDWAGWILTGDPE